jgi:hypothetical protein
MATASAGLALLGGANKLLSVLSGAKKTVAMLLIGLLGLLVPLIVILLATNFLLYGPPPSLLGAFSPLAVPVVGVIGIAIAIPLGLRRQSFTTGELLAVGGLLIASLVMVLMVIVLSFAALDREAQGYARLDETNQISFVASALETVANTQEVAPEVAPLVDEFVSADRERKRASAELDRALGAAGELQKELDRAYGVTGFFRELRALQNVSRASAQVFSSRLRLVSLAGDLSAHSSESLAPLHRAINARAHGQLLETISIKAGSEDSVAELLCSALVERLLASFHAEATQPDSGLEADPMGIVRRRFRILIADSAHKHPIDSARAILHQSAVSDLAILIGEEQLSRAVASKFSNVPGKAETAKLAGKEELANLLTKKEMLDLVLPAEAHARGALVTRTQRDWLLQEALPRFPEQGTQHFEEQTLDTARVLARLAELVPTAPEPGADARLSQGLALFYTTRPYLAPPARGPDRKSVVGEDPTEAEIARAAGARLAGRALRALDADHLRALAFGERGIDPQEGSLEADWDSVWKDRVKGEGSAQWREFLEQEKRPLKDLAALAFPLPQGNGCTADAEDSSLPQDVLEQRPYQLPCEYRYKTLLAERALGSDTDVLARLARVILIERALGPDDGWLTAAEERKSILQGFAHFDAASLAKEELAPIAVAGFWGSDPEAVEELIAKFMLGAHARLERSGLAEVREQVTNAFMLPKVIFVSLLAVVIWLLWWLTVDVNLTSIHGLYRDRLASAFLVGKDTKGHIGIEDDIDLYDICRYEAGSTAPYHLINVALNLQGSRDIGLRGRKSDFFIFSKRFVGGHRTGYCRSETLEQVFPQMDVATAMAISAAAASPNMGRATSPFLVAFMTLLNIRLGYWVPNPGLLEEKRDKAWKQRARKPRPATKPPGYTFEEVFTEELRDIESRWGQVCRDGSRRRLTNQDGNCQPTVEHGLVGIGFSGGGIRSASLNLGITQALHKYGVFDHLDYMSTVSGGGYLGSSISTLMRARENSELAGTVTIEAKDGKTVIVTPSEAGKTPRTYRFSDRATLNVGDGERISAGTPLLKPRAARGRSDIAGRVTVEETTTGERSVRVQGKQSDGLRDYRFSRFDSVVVRTDELVKAGDKLIRRYDTLGGRFSWRVRPAAFLREMGGKLDETHRWVNLSDGGHIENLAAIELLRRRCKYIIIGDGEADPELHFAGLATLMRCAFIDLGIRIEINLDAIRLRASAEEGAKGGVSGAHWAVGTITYPGNDGNSQAETGYLLYLKSSFTGDEDEMIREYRHRNPTFPHQSTADQFFDEDQFEAYRALGQHIAEGALRVSHPATPTAKMSFANLEDWFRHLREKNKEKSAVQSA